MSEKLGVRSYVGRLALVLLLLASPAAAQDAFDLHQAIIHSSPADVADWPIAAPITRVDVQPGIGGGFNIQSAALAQWPDYTPAGWAGPIEYTLWAFVSIDGGWHGAGFIQEWRGRGFSGAGWLEDDPNKPGTLMYNGEWAYDANRWGAMADYVPKAGDTIGLMLTAGNARGVGGVTSVRSRTNVVAVRLPAGDVGVFDFAAAPPVITPSPMPMPPPAPPVIAPPVPPQPTLDLSGVTTLLNTIIAAQQQMLTVEQDTNAHVASINKTIGQTLGDVAAFIGKYIAPAVGAFIAAKKL